MTPQPKTPLPIVFGAMTFGSKGVEQARVHTLPECGAILDIFQSHGHTEIDTARTYCDGTSEELLGELDWAGRGLVMHTKYYPTGNKPSIAPPGSPEGGWLHTPEHLRINLLASLKALKSKKIELWYLHGPDRQTPYATTLEAVNTLHQEGHFKHFGLSNFAAWEVALISELCIKNNWIRPTVYQGVYNCLRRSVETDLFPCLRYYGIAFYVFNPLAGGLLTARYHFNPEYSLEGGGGGLKGGDAEGGIEIEEGSRFDPSKTQGKQYRARYWKAEYFSALENLRREAGKYGLMEAECALRWLNHHSVLRREKGDKIIIGASSVRHIEENLRFLEDEKGLPESVVRVLEEGWKACKGVESSYFH